jgi:hypothetical protein
MMQSSQGLAAAPEPVSDEKDHIRRLTTYWLEAGQRDDRMARSYKGLLKRVSHNQYTDAGRIFLELLQNCEDAPFTRPPGARPPPGRPAVCPHSHAHEVRCCESAAHSLGLRVQAARRAG